MGTVCTNTYQVAGRGNGYAVSNVVPFSWNSGVRFIGSRKGVHGRHVDRMFLAGDQADTHNPQTNGLCEVQHKTLTRELRVRGQRKNTPSWADLLSEIQFAINISLADEAPHLSPFQLVFGRSVRLSAVDITFPSNTKVHVPTSEQLARAHAENLKQLTYMRFRALDNQIERKETSTTSCSSISRNVGSCTTTF